MKRGVSNHSKLSFSIILLIMGYFSCFSQNMKVFADSISNDFLNDNKNYGLAVGILDEENKKMYYYGGKTCTDGNDIDSLSIFEIGSVTKLYTGYIFAALEKDRKLSRYNLVSKYLPSTITKNKNWADKIRLIDLATHTSGLPGFDSTRELQTIDGFDENDPFGLFTNTFMLNILKETDSILNYGKVVYSNFGIGLLGLSLEQITNQSFDELLIRYIINPFHLKSTYSHLDEKNIINLAIPHRGKEAKPLIQLAKLEASGILKTSLPDLLTFLEHHLYPENTQQNEIVASVLENQLKESDTRVGIGWGIHTILGETVYFHNGGTYGSSSVVIIVPKFKIGIAILANSIDGGKLTSYAISFVEKMIKEKSKNR
ncbi:serine hydrolase [Flavobacteriaceae bacterium R38]|nr:serine hydrolase [Flavobacteriaceae bacterium R38]